jgi:RNA polymerase sigma-70 factor (ECF subfamily)
MGAETDSVSVGDWLDRLRAGDDSARHALLARAFDRLMRLARKMLMDYPGVSRWEQTDDVFQNAMIRLDRALESVTPATPRDFFRLAAAEIRRELIDLARRYGGPGWMGVHQAAHTPADTSLEPSRAPAVAPDSSDPARLHAWTEFHRRVGELPDEAREIFDLLWYQGLTQVEAAAILGVAEKTVNRRWMAARVRLGTMMAGQPAF